MIKEASVKHDLLGVPSTQLMIARFKPLGGILRQRNQLQISYMQFTVALSLVDCATVLIASVVTTYSDATAILTTANTYFALHVWMFRISVI